MIVQHKEHVREQRGHAILVKIQHCGLWLAVKSDLAAVHRCCVVLLETSADRQLK